MLIAAGLPGYGKTHYIQEGLASRTAGVRVLIIDPHASLDRSNRNPKRRPWAGELVTYHDLLRYDGEHLLASTGQLVIDPGTLDEEISGRRVSRILAMVWAAQDWDVVLEEAGLYSRSALPLINLLSTGGGHANIRLILIAQSIGRITIDARRNASHLALWPQSEPSDYQELKSKIGRAGVQRLATMPNPPPYSAPVTWKQGQVPEELTGS